MGKIRISPWLVAALGLLFYLDPIGLFAPFLCAAALHELGHLGAMAALRVRPTALRLGLHGAVLQTGLLGYGRELLCAAAGPAVNLLLFFLFRRMFTLFAIVNLCLGLYNLIPLYPLDGGRILRCAAGKLLGEPERFLRRSRVAVWCVGGLLAAYACLWLRLGIWPMLLAGLVAVRTGGEKLVAKRELGS